jgi:aspartyl-tRNA(Asn)/glutamyl-tRNA(Gln) amidotransferase subunit C
MDISRDQIRQLGTLARLELTDQEIETLSKQLPGIVDYVSHLQSIDTTAVAESDRPVTPLRPDEVKMFEAMQAILNQAPEKSGQNWKVDAVFS